MVLFWRNRERESSQDAISKLKETISLLEKKEKYLQVKINNELSLAKANAFTNKRVALMAMRRKKHYEKELLKISETAITLETQMMALENAAVNLEAFKAIKAGSDAMKTIHGSINIDKIDDTIESIKEQRDIAGEISSVISQSVNFGSEINEDELREELESLEQDELDSRLLEINESQLKTKQKTDLDKTYKERFKDETDEELDELVTSMAL